MKIHRASAFVTEDGHGGNPAGVVLGAQGLTGTERQKLAEEINLSETAFHSVDEQGKDELEFYTPTTRINNCGHATVAAFGALSRLRSPGDYVVRISHRDYTVRIEDDLIGLRQNIISYRATPANIELEAISSLKLPGDILRSSALVDVGVLYLVIELDSLRSLKGIVPDFARISAMYARDGILGFYLYTSENGKLYSRMFAPGIGISEESATGMGAVCLMVKLNHEKNLKEALVIQGSAMNPPSPSELMLKVDGDSVWVSGRFRLEEQKI